MDERKEIALAEMVASLEIQLALTEEYRATRSNAVRGTVTYEIADSLVMESIHRCETIKRAYLLLRSLWE